MIRNVPRPGGSLSLFRRAFAVLLFGFVLLAGASSGFAQDPVTPALAAEAESLIQALIALNTRYQLAGPAERSQLLDKLERVAAERHQLLASFIQDHSDRVAARPVPKGCGPVFATRYRPTSRSSKPLKGSSKSFTLTIKSPVRATTAISSRSVEKTLFRRRGASRHFAWGFRDSWAAALSPFCFTVFSIHI